MERTFIVGSTLQNWLHLKSLLLSKNPNSLVSANELVKKLDLSETEKDIIIDYLNNTYSKWHFFIENCEIKKVRSHKEDANKESKNFLLYRGSPDVLYRLDQ